MRGTWVAGLLSATMLVGCALNDDELERDELDTGEQTVINNDPDFLYVYTNNIENLEEPTDGCRGDWKDLIFEMKSDVASPDLFLVQQISGRPQLDRLTDFMSATLHGTYAGVIAEASPEPMASPCGAQKRFQTNAIIYRVGRLEPVGAKEVWQVVTRVDGECRRNHQSRTKAVMQKFRDKISGKHVTAASIHWATGQGAACARINAAEVDAKLRSTGFRSALSVFGGDTNQRDRDGDGYQAWYALLNGDRNGELGYRDVIYRHCMTGDRAVRACLDDNWTIGSANRIDYLFARRADGTLPPQGRAHTITYEEADAAADRFVGSDASANYSDHRAIRARIYY